MTINQQRQIARSNRCQTTTEISSDRLQNRIVARRRDQQRQNGKSSRCDRLQKRAVDRRRLRSAATDWNENENQTTATTRAPLPHCQACVTVMSARLGPIRPACACRFFCDHHVCPLVLDRSSQRQPDRSAH